MPSCERRNPRRGKVGLGEQEKCFGLGVVLKTIETDPGKREEEASAVKRLSRCEISSRLVFFFRFLFCLFYVFYIWPLRASFFFTGLFTLQLVLQCWWDDISIILFFLFTLPISRPFFPFVCLIRFPCFLCVVRVWAMFSSKHGHKLYEKLGERETRFARRMRCPAKLGMTRR